MELSKKFLLSLSTGFLITKTPIFFSNSLIAESKPVVPAKYLEFERSKVIPCRDLFGLTLHAVIQG